ncbi:hypothetical protein FB451DRAFT_1552271 [Mycena latifolia]|nr:hypothetical protein FB451DRAFT_1552271 [Mycena latifolia]
MEAAIKCLIPVGIKQFCLDAAPDTPVATQVCALTALARPLCARGPSTLHHLVHPRLSHPTTAARRCPLAERVVREWYVVRPPPCLSFLDVVCARRRRMKSLLTMRTKVGGSDSAQSPEVPPTSTSPPRARRRRSGVRFAMRGCRVGAAHQARRLRAPEECGRPALQESRRGVAAHSPVPTRMGTHLMPCAQKATPANSRVVMLTRLAR